jgi:osmotically inducible lipoprotein OsmB
VAAGKYRSRPSFEPRPLPFSRPLSKLNLAKDRGDSGMIMRRLMLVGAAIAAVVLVPASGGAGERHVTGAAIGAGLGAIVAGPPGAVLGGAVGAFLKGPRITRRHCWTAKSGRRYCEWR